tara:strand:+ start:452 stop:799 length:348 start_codon:yes stop_codon:yes gene_type:complete
MRKIDKDVAVAFLEDRNFRGGNTVVTTEGVWLHGNQIIRSIDSGSWAEANQVQFTLCGWDTPTTRARISAILELLEGNMTLKKIKGQTYLIDGMDKTKMPIADDDWYFPRVVEVA